MVDGAGSKSAMEDTGLVEQVKDSKSIIRAWLAKKPNLVVPGAQFVRYEQVPLHPKDWKTCLSCQGTGSYYSPGDLHRSAGYEPCSCDKGLVKFLVRRVYRVKAKGVKR